jgi:hypothetical protein
MNSRHQQFKQELGLLGAICGSLLIGLPAIAQTNPTPRNINPADRERICAEYRNMNQNQAQTSAGTTDTTANSDRTPGATGTTTSGDRTPGATGTTTSGDRTPGATGTTTSGDRTALGNMSAAELERLCAGLSDPSGTNRNPPNTQGDRTEPNNPGTTPNTQRNQTRPNNPSTSPTTPQRRSSRIVPPTPEQQQAASAQINPLNDKISIKLVNQTGTDITYQVIGDTNQRTLPSRSEAILQTLDVPSTITFYRSDYGLLMARPQATSQPGLLEVSLLATTDLGMDKNALTVERTGAVYLN